MLNLKESLLVDRSLVQPLDQVKDLVLNQLKDLFLFPLLFPRDTLDLLPQVNLLPALPPSPPLIPLLLLLILLFNLLLNTLESQLRAPLGSPQSLLLLSLLSLPLSSQ